MAQEWAKPFYNSAVWKKQREYILKRDHHLCTQPGCHNVATEVHHIIELSETNINDVNIALNENNLRSVCHDCHVALTKQIKANADNILPIISFDDNGYPVELNDRTL